MKLFTIRLSQFLSRVKVASRILFSNNHWVMLTVDRKDLKKLICDEGVSINFYWCRLQPYLVYKMVKIISESVDEDDMILEKAKFEAEAELYSKNLKK